jgi:outer membrane autotransporter protein
MNAFRKKPIGLAISYALLTALSPAGAAEYEQIDLSSATGESLTLTGDHVTHTGKGPSIKVSGPNNLFLGTDLDIKAISGTDNDAVSGVQVLSGGRAELERSTIIASGYFGDGANASGSGSYLSLRDTDVVTNGSRGRGVMVDKGASAELVGGTLSTSGLTADVLSAMGIGSTLHATGSTLSSSGSVAYAVRAQKGAYIELTGGSATTYGQSAPVFAITGADTVIKADGVSALSQKSQGADIAEGQFIFSNGILKAKGDGILIRPSSQQGGQASVSHSQIVSQAGNGVNLDAHQATAQLSTVKVTTEGNYGSAIWMPGSDSHAQVRDSQLETWGAQAAAVDNRAGVFEMGGGSVVTHGNSAHGLYASTDVIGDPAQDPMASFDVRNVSIETFGDGSVGALARYSGTHIAITDSQVLTHGDVAHGLFASSKGAELELTNSHVTTEGQSAYGVHVSNNGGARVQGSQIETFGDNAYALVSQATGTGVNNQVQLVDSDVLSRQASALRVSGGSLDLNLTNSTLSSRNGEDTGTAIWTTGGGNDVAAGQVRVHSQDSLIDGDIRADAGELHLDLHGHSVLQGAIRDPGRGTFLTMDRDSVWSMGGDSSVAAMTNNGVVDFGTPTQAHFTHLNVSGDLDGDGRYLMNTDLGARVGDRLDVEGQVTGNNQIMVRNSGSEPVAAGQSLTLVQSNGGVGGFQLANRDEVVDVGTYRYVLRRDNGQAGGAQGDSRWSLVNVAQLNPEPEPKPDPKPEPEPEPEPKPDPVPVDPEVPSTPAPVPPPVDPIVPVPPPAPSAQSLSTAASAAINSSALATLRSTWDAERSTLIQRLGDVRQERLPEGVWIRGLGQKQRLDNGVGRHFSQRVNGVQLGVDTRIATADGLLILGGLIGYSHTNRRFNGEGSGKLDSYHVGAYATYLDDSGWYADSLLTVNRWSTRLDVQGSDGVPIKGHSRTHGAGVSLEAGKRLDLDRGWFVEPQVQLSALYASGDDYGLSNDMRVNADGGVSTQARAGSRIGRELDFQRGARLQPYLKMGWTQDLSARNSVRTNDIASHPDGNGGGWYAGAGVTGSLGAGQHVYADLETSDSSTLKRPWALNIGYRVAW